MDDESRRDILNALKNESRSEQRRIFATLNSFKNWLYIACYIAYRKLELQLERAWLWLRSAFA